MRILSATEPGTAGRPNEDFAATTAGSSGQGGALVVLDGVTPPQGDYGCLHGVPWFAARLGGSLLGLAAAQGGPPLRECLATAVLRTADAHRDTCDLSHARTPQATVAVARWDAGTVECLVLSDAVLLLGLSDGTVRTVLDTRLDDLRPAHRGLPAGERAARLESLRNHEDGFFTAAADPSVASRAVTGTLPREAVTGLAALTDGAGRWVDVFGFGDWAALYGLLSREGPEAVIGEVRAAEAADPAGTAFPRGKCHDDATVVLARP
ncbi:hypothetical protein PJ985_08335 [Streptomyces sp. ACA25]|uniref:hypothetical protein n=1 Tax=Streptomyces sp. ACA25 TaxID=3022596 RepID=UPI00230700D0|nr:hypothetical protein [Streptomyces sp. ACA25]MDB1087573.1 hypothetical protein [Streptomyces sp. ACA25]